MVFFGKNLKTKHKVALCLAMLGILMNCWECTRMPLGTFPYVEFNDGNIRFYTTKIVLSFGIFVKMLMICIFRKF